MVQIIITIIVCLTTIVLAVIIKKPQTYKPKLKGPTPEARDSFLHEDFKKKKKCQL